MEITIIINGKHIKMNVSKDEKFKDIKKNIIQTHFESKNDRFWIEFVFRGEKTIREFGKHNLIVDDIIPITIDKLSLSNFSERDDIDYTFEVIESFKDEEVEIKPITLDSSKYIPSFRRNKQDKKPIPFAVSDYDAEFPTL